MEKCIVLIVIGMLIVPTSGCSKKEEQKTAVVTNTFVPVTIAKSTGGDGKDFILKFLKLVQSNELEHAAQSVHIKKELCDQKTKKEPEYKRSASYDTCIQNEYDEVVRKLSQSTELFPKTATIEHVETDIVPDYGEKRAFPQYIHFVKISYPNSHSSPHNYKEIMVSVTFPSHDGKILYSDGSIIKLKDVLATY